MSVLTRFDAWLTGDDPAALVIREPLMPVEGPDGVLFPATFALARHAGWTAHALEQARANVLIRPDVRYVGPDERHLPSG